MAMPTVSYGIASMISYLFEITTLQTKIIATIVLLIWFVLLNFELKILAKIQSALFWSTLAVSMIADIIFICSGIFSTPEYSWSLANLSPWFPQGGSGFMAAITLDATAWLVLAAYIVVGLCFWGHAKMMQKRGAANWEMKITSPDTDKIAEE